MKLMVLAVVAVAVAGCATSFSGNAHFPGGPGACAKKCEGEGLTMESFVYAGEYSSACVCSPKGKATASSGAEGTVPPAAGVVMQMQRAQEQQQGGH